MFCARLMRHGLLDKIGDIKAIWWEKKSEHKRRKIRYLLVLPPTFSSKLQARQTTRMIISSDLIGLSFVRNGEMNSKPYIQATIEILIVAKIF